MDRIPMTLQRMYVPRCIDEKGNEGRQGKNIAIRKDAKDSNGLVGVWNGHTMDGCGNLM